MKFKQERVAALKAGACYIQNEVGGIETLNALLQEACGRPVARTNGQAKFYGIALLTSAADEPDSLDWHALTPENYVQTGCASFKLYDFLEDPSEAGIRIDCRPCVGTCEACACSRDTMIHFEGRVLDVSEKSKSFSAMVIKGTEAGSWSHQTWLPLSLASYFPIDGKWRISAPLWLLQDRGIEYSITLFRKI